MGQCQWLDSVTDAIANSSPRESAFSALAGVAERVRRRPIPTGDAVVPRRGGSPTSSINRAICLTRKRVVESAACFATPFADVAGRRGSPAFPRFFFPPVAKGTISRLSPVSTAFLLEFPVSRLTRCATRTRPLSPPDAFRRASQISVARGAFSLSLSFAPLRQRPPYLITFFDKFHGSSNLALSPCDRSP